MLTYDNWSRLKYAATTLVDGVEVPNTWAPPAWVYGGLQDSQISFYSVPSSMEGRADLISQLYYHTTLLDWLLITYNNATDTLNWPRAGQVIRIPSVGLVYSELS